MKEIKFLKDLPIKLTNENKRVLNVIGGDIYYDTIMTRGFYGADTVQQKKNNELFQEKGLWGFIEPLF